MVDAVVTTKYDGSRNAVFKLTNVSDGTGETLVKKVDVNTLSPNPGAHIKLRRVRYSIHGGAVRLLWEATNNVDLIYLPENTNILEFDKIYAGGWPVPNVAGATGNVLLSTVGFGPNSGYTIELEFIKGVALI